MPLIDGTLTRKEKNFCEEYVRCGSATAAYQAAYNCAYTTANAQGYRMLRKDGIKDYIKELQKAEFEGACITAERVGLKLAEIAFAAKDDEQYTPTAQLKALDLLSKQLGLQQTHIIADVNTDINITIDE